MELRSSAGRPCRSRGTGIAPRTGSNCGESPRCPAVISRVGWSRSRRTRPAPCGAGLRRVHARSVRARHNARLWTRRPHSSDGHGRFSAECRTRAAPRTRRTGRPRHPCRTLRASGTARAMGCAPHPVRTRRTGLRALCRSLPAPDLDEPAQGERRVDLRPAQMEALRRFAGVAHGLAAAPADGFVDRVRTATFNLTRPTRPS
ncbi:DUF6417 family protein [Streptomyces sp. W16]|nr:DUF6417 family protein [Streptomyces sp. W16]